MDATSKLFTAALKISAYLTPSARRDFLSHTFDKETGQSLCSKQTVAQTLGEDEEKAAAAPTCKRCLKKDPRFAGAK